MLKRLVRELRRRRVPQVAGFYLAAGWVVFEVAESTFPRLGLPDWTITFVLILLLLAFPLVVGLAWFYDVTPEGLRRTPAPAHNGPSEAGASADRAFGRIAVAGAIVVLALAGGAFVIFGGGDGEVKVAADAMVVLPFTVRGGDDVDVLAEGMVDLLSAKLDGVGELRSADPNAVLSLAGGAVDATGGRDLARRLGAGHYVLGSVLEFGGDLRLQAAIYETEGAGEPVAEADVEGPVTSFLALVDELAADLLVAGDLAPPGRMPRIAALTTDDLDALRHFLEGERALRDTRYDDAIARFERAVEADTAFALAYYRMAVASSWAERHALKERAIDNATVHENRLSERDRALLAAFAARQAGRHAEALRRYRAIVTSYPADLEAWYELGEVMLHRSHVLGIPLSELAGPFERTLELDPGHGVALYHLSNVAAWVRDTATVDSITRVFRERMGGRAPLSLEAQWAFLAGDAAARDTILDAAGADGNWSDYAFAAFATDDLDKARALMTACEVASAPPYVSEAIATIVADMGHRTEALDWLEAREAGTPGPPVRTALLAAQPFLRTPAPRLEGLRERLLAWDPGGPRMEPIEAEEWGSLDPIRPQLRLYLLGLLDARLGADGGALRWAEELEAMDGAPEIRTLGADLGRHIRAQVHFDQGSPAEALRVIEGASFWEKSDWDERLATVYGYDGPILLRAEALMALGRLREAVRWFSTTLNLTSPGYNHYRRAQAYEALGELDRAAADYSLFVHRWADADPDLQDLVQDARRRLEALATER